MVSNTMIQMAPPDSHIGKWLVMKKRQSRILLILYLSACSIASVSCNEPRQPHSDKLKTSANKRFFYISKRKCFFWCGKYTHFL